MKYQNAVSFRQALESRLTQISKDTGIDLQWLRKQVAFDRLLARIFLKEDKPRWLLKGGYAMELRFSHLARVTKDMDLSLPSIFPEIKEKPIPQSIQMRSKTWLVTIWVIALFMKSRLLLKNLTQRLMGALAFQLA